ncbi:MAG: hypothetical protein R2706_08115 [Acidimicrobiales bacterium]
MEAIVRPVTWDEWLDLATPIFQAMRSEAGEEMVLTKNVFVERILPGSILRDLSDEEMAEYRRPFDAAGEDRRPTLTWPRQIPIEEHRPTSTRSSGRMPTGSPPRQSRSCSSTLNQAAS